MNNDYFSPGKNYNIINDFIKLIIFFIVALIFLRLSPMTHNPSLMESVIFLAIWLILFGLYSGKRIEGEIGNPLIGSLEIKEVYLLTQLRGWVLFILFALPVLSLFSFSFIILPLLVLFIASLILFWISKHISPKARKFAISGAIFLLVLSIASGLMYFRKAPYPIDDSLTNRGQTKLHLIPLGQKEQFVADVIFVHGLMGDPYETWGSNKETFPFAQWLSEDVSDLRFWTLGYSAEASEWVKEAMPLQRRAVNVLATLKSKGLGEKPIFFIAHSLGGLLVKQVLREANTTSANEYLDIVKNTRGVIFFSTPHTGADLASFVDFFLQDSARPSAAIKDLTAHNPMLEELNHWYRNNARDLNIETKVYYEHFKTSSHGLSLLLVNSTSADPGIPGVNPICIDAHHMAICKLSSKEDVAYGPTRDFLKRILQKSQESFAH